MYCERKRQHEYNIRFVQFIDIASAYLQLTVIEISIACLHSVKYFHYNGGPMKSTIAALLFVGVLVASSVSVAHACPNLASYVFGEPTQSINAYFFPFALEQEPEFYAGASASNASFTVFLPNGTIL